jgi:hypothetical protein
MGRLEVLCLQEAPDDQRCEFVAISGSKRKVLTIGGALAVVALLVAAGLSVGAHFARKGSEQRTSRESTSQTTDPEVSGGTINLKIGTYVTINNGLADFALTAAEINECPDHTTARPGKKLSPAENGYFLVLTFVLETYSEAERDGLSLKSLPNSLFNPNNFSIPDSRGVVITDVATAPTFGCVHDGAPSVFLPNSRYEFQVALDSPVGSGVVTLATPVIDGSLSWEFPS